MAILVIVLFQGHLPLQFVKYSHWAFLAAVITNGFGAITSMFSKRKHKAVGPDDFMGKEAKEMLQRLLGQEPEQKDWSRHIEEARAKGLKGGETLC